MLPFSWDYEIISLNFNIYNIKNPSINYLEKKWNKKNLIKSNERNIGNTLSKKNISLFNG